jgi:hypothetical protein
MRFIMRNNFDYEYRIKIFDTNGYKVIFLHLYKEQIKWKYHLMSYLKLVTYSRYSKFNELIMI